MWNSKFSRIARETRGACLCISNIPRYKILKLMAKLLGHVNLIGRSEFCLNSMSCQKPWSARAQKNNHNSTTFANFRSTGDPSPWLKWLFYAFLLHQGQHHSLIMPHWYWVIDCMSTFRNAGRTGKLLSFPCFTLTVCLSHGCGRACKFGFAFCAHSNKAGGQ